jgi:hemoglobin
LLRRAGLGSGTLLVMTTPTLFQRLGGEVSIDVAVDQFYDRLLNDPELAPFFASVDMRRQRAHQKAFLAMALGGPRKYGGRSLGEAHSHLDINDRHFDLVAGHLAAVLEGLGVPQELIDEVVMAIDGLRDIVLGRTPEATRQLEDAVAGQ